MVRFRVGGSMMKIISKALKRKQPACWWRSKFISPPSFATGGCQKLLEAIASPAIKINLDAANMIRYLEYWSSSDYIREGIESLGAMIETCHAKDVMLHNALHLHMDEYPAGEGCPQLWLTSKTARTKLACRCSSRPAAAKGSAALTQNSYAIRRRSDAVCVNRERTLLLRSAACGWQSEYAQAIAIQFTVVEKEPLDGKRH